MSASGSYEGLVGVVTGAGQGIGADVARGIVDRGGAVVLADIDGERVDALAKMLGDRAIGVHVDVTREADLEAMVRAAGEKFGRLDVAFNVAGAGRMRSFVNMTDHEWDFTLDICLKGVVFAMKHEARRMIADGNGGAIVNVSSVNGETPMFGNAAYCTAKAGVVMLTKCGALEFAENGIRVNAVSPGLVATRMTEVALGAPAVRAAYMERIPAKRPASPSEIADVALFLGSPAAGYVTGTNLFADGGWSLTTYPDTRPSTLEKR